MKEDNYLIKENIGKLSDINSIVELVNSIILLGYKRRASDIHIDPNVEGTVIRYRVDGVLLYVDTIKNTSHDELISRIKILSSLRTDVHFAPQDGRFNFREDSTMCDVRVSILPTHYGENAVLRILEYKKSIQSLKDLGFSEHDELRIVNHINKHQGMILVTGPTGSGKTSTLYTILNYLKRLNVSIITLEDPIEYAISGIRQIHIREKHGITFANGLRSVVRQDPDIIMVGEIRDRDTAQIATNISLTGHLLISTLHTNDAVSSIPRLIDMGIDPYLVASTLSMIIAQRLVRVICKNCKTDGCNECSNSGYLGRTVISETLTVDDEMRKYIMARVSISDIARYAKVNGMVTMYEDGMGKVDKGLTTKLEILRVLND